MAPRPSNPSRACSSPGVVPGLMLAALFSGYIMLWSLLNRDRDAAAGPGLPRWRGAARRRAACCRCVGLIVAVIGSIYAGVASPTEAAVIGVPGALLLAWATGALSCAGFCDALRAATITTCMISFILAGRGLPDRGDGLYRHPARSWPPGSARWGCRPTRCWRR